MNAPKTNAPAGDAEGPADDTGAARSDADTTKGNAAVVLAQAVGWLDAGLRVALATVTRTWGSAPRCAGSHMAVAENGDFCGSVSGGCIESAVVQAAMEVMESGTPRSLEFGVTNEMAWEVGLACGGKVHLFVERLGAGERLGDWDPIRSVLDGRRRGREVVVATRLSDGRKELIWADSGPLRATPRTPPGSPANGPKPTRAIVEPDEVAAALRSADSRVVETPGGPVFLRPYVRPPHLIVVGAVHIAQALASMAATAGFRVTVLDPRRGFATARRFPECTLICDWPDRAMADLALDRRTAVAALTHDPKIDDPALRAALDSEAFYVGALGSRRTQAERRERLTAAGCPKAALDRIRGPIGLPIGAKTPEEIAVAVLAEIVEALRLRFGERRHSRDRRL